MKNLKSIVSILIVLGILLALLSLASVVTRRPLTDLESILLQFISLAIGCSVSFFVGQRSVQKAVEEIVKPHARSAARHLISLYKSVSRARVAASMGLPQHFESHGDYNLIRGYLIAIFTEQLATADDALENWRDILGEELEDLIQKLQEENTTPEELEDLIQKLPHDNTTRDRQ